MFRNCLGSDRINLPPFAKLSGFTGGDVFYWWKNVHITCKERGDQGMLAFIFFWVFQLKEYWFVKRLDSNFRYSAAQLVLDGCLTSRGGHLFNVRRGRWVTILLGPFSASIGRSKGCQGPSTLSMTRHHFGASKAIIVFDGWWRLVLVTQCVYWMQKKIAWKCKDVCKLFKHAFLALMRREVLARKAPWCKMHHWNILVTRFTRREFQGGRFCRT